MNNIRVSAAVGELRTNTAILTRLNEAVRHHDFSLMVLFPTQSLLRHIEEQFFRLSGAGGLGGIRLLLFEGFINEITEILGMSQYRPSPLIRELFIARAFHELEQSGSLHYLNQVPFSLAYRQAILGGISEWKRSGLTVEIFREWAAEKGPKEREMSLLYSKYQDLLTEYGYYEEDNLFHELESLYRQSTGNETSGKVLLYGFNDLTPLQSDYLKVLSLWFDFEAIVDPTHIPEFRAFTAGNFPLPAAPVTGSTGETAEEHGTVLNRLQGRFWADKPHPIPVADGDLSVQLLVPGGIYRQATGIARSIKQWLFETPDATYEDILIITPQPQEFIHAARPIFRDYNLRLEETVETVREFPAVHRFTLCLTAAGADWPWNDMESLIRKFYPVTSLETADKIMILIAERFGALSGKKRWLALLEDPGFTERAAEKGWDLTPIQTGLTRLAEIPEQASLEIYLRLAADWFRNCPIHFGDNRELFRRYIDDCRAVQLMEETIREILAQPGIFGVSEVIGLRDFQLFYEEYLLALELKSSSRASEAIRAIQLREARGLKARLVFITGLEQGVCPKVYINDWKLGPKARWELKSLGIELETGDQYYREERISFYWALQTATEQLVFVSRDQDEGGQPLNRSPFLDDILAWLPGLRPSAIRYPAAPGLPDDFSHCLSKKEQRNRLTAYLAANPSELPKGQTGLCQDLVSQPENRRMIEHLIERFSERPGKTPFLEEQASMGLLHRMYGLGKLFPVTVLEDYQNCPLRFYFRHLLKVRIVPRPELRPEGPDLGILYHRILHDFADLYRDQSLEEDKRDEYQRRLHDVYKTAFHEWRQNAANDLVDFILEILGKQIEGVLTHWLETELDWAAASGRRFRFSGLELAFGFARGDFDPDSLAEPFRLDPAGEDIRLAGKIDRVDTDNEGRFIVYDYKLGKGPDFKDLLDGKRFQIPLYIMALEQLKYGEGKGLGGSYLGLSDLSRTSGGLWNQRCQGMPGDADSVLPDNLWREWLQSTQLKVIGLVKSIRAGRFLNLSEECHAYCEYRTACRRQEWEVENTDDNTG